MSFIIPVIPKEISNLKTSFGELSVSNDVPVSQISANYGFTPKIFTAVLNGSVSESTSLFIADTTTATNGTSVILSKKEIKYRSGQGIKSIFSAIFSNGKINSTQISGLIKSESSLCFGYNGIDFGIVLGNNGKLEYRILTVTTSSNATEVASITIDGILFNVPLTSGTANLNAYQIANYLTLNDGRYNYESIGNVINILGKLPDFGGGIFNFTSGSAVASFTLITNKALQNETWIKKSAWNQNNSINLDPTKGNVYMIQFSYTGFDGVRFYVKDYITDEFILVHIIKYGNSNILPIVDDPTFSVGWAVKNKGNNTSIKVKGSSASLFNEGMIHYDNESSGYCFTNSVSAGSIQNILTIRNRLIINNKPNRSKILPIDLTLSTEAIKTTNFYIYLNAEIASYISEGLQFIDISNTELAQIATQNVTIIGGTLISCFNTKSTLQVNINRIIDSLSPGDSITIGAKFTSGAVSDILASLVWKNDL